MSFFVFIVFSQADHTVIVDVGWTKSIRVRNKVLKIEHINQMSVQISQEMNAKRLMHGSFLSSWAVWSVSLRNHFWSEVSKGRKGDKANVGLLCYIWTWSFFSSLMWGGGGGRGRFNGPPLRLVPKKREKNSTWMEKDSEDTNKSENGEWEKRNGKLSIGIFLCCFVLDLLFYNEEHIFSSIFTFAFKNNQLNSRNEKIDYNERSGLRETDFFQEQI